MDYFNYNDNALFAEETSIEEIVEEFGTPVYVYSYKTISHHFNVFKKALGDYPHRICYSVKSNSNIAIIQALNEMGASFDIVSIGEFERVMKAGGCPENMVFSGVGKSEHELKIALKAGISCFNIESENELLRLERIAEKEKITASISIRINPDVDPKTHKFITTGKVDNKFGVDITKATELYKKANDMKYINIEGVDYHIGSQICTLKPLLDAVDVAVSFIKELKKNGISVRHLDIGGGLGIRYNDETPPSPQEYLSQVIEKIKGLDIELYVEPGRAIVGNSGVLVTKVEYIKETNSKNFIIVDAGMNDYIRTSLYESWQDVLPVKNSDYPALKGDIVGPICESSDVFARDRNIAVKEGDLLVIRSVGAYGFCMSSNYNSRPRPPEVMVKNSTPYLIRRRETVEDLFLQERLLG